MRRQSCKEPNELPSFSAVRVTILFFSDLYMQSGEKQAYNSEEEDHQRQAVECSSRLLGISDSP